MRRQGPPAPAGPRPRVVRPGLFAHRPPIFEVATEDGSLLAGTRDGDLYVRSVSTEEESIVARAGNSWRWDVEGARWSPDGAWLAALQIDDTEVPRVPITDWSDETVRLVPFSRVGEPLPQHRIVLVDSHSGTLVPVVPEDPTSVYVHPVAFSADGKRFRYFEADRLAKRLDLVEFDLGSGASRRILREAGATNVLGLEVLYGYSAALQQRALAHVLDARETLISTSERSGFRHLYVYDLEGNLEGTLTEGRLDGHVDRVVAIDESRGRVFFTAHADPEARYAEQLYRADLDGGELLRISDGPVIKSVQLSPEGTRLSVLRTGLPDLLQVDRISADGESLRTEWRADWSFLEGIELDARRLVPPAADGVTELDALLFLPPRLDPLQTYPVVELIYGGPNTRFVPREPQQPQYWEAHSLASQGYAVVIIDARGTPGRGRAFADANYGALGAHVIEDHSAALQHLLATHPYLDPQRVAVLGHSWGGHFALRALLEAPELYNAAVLAAPGFEVENFRVAAEPFMGCLPADCPEAYAQRAMGPRLGDLQGPVLILHGTADDDVPLSESLTLVEALDSAGRDHELHLALGVNHIVQRWPHFWPHFWPHVTRFLDEHVR